MKRAISESLRPVPGAEFASVGLAGAVGPHGASGVEANVARFAGRERSAARKAALAEVRS
ncbi:MAG: hypothetical protein R6X17_04480 [Candidatus Competibacteraceae bacterium]